MPNQQVHARINHRVSFWKEQLKDVLPSIELVYDRPKSGNNFYSRKNFQFLLSKFVRDRLRNLADKANCNFYNVLLTAFNILLFRYTHQEDLLIAIETPEVKGVNEFGNLDSPQRTTVVLRNRLSGELSFLKLLKQVSNLVTEVQTNQEIFSTYVEELLSKKSLTMDSLFQIVFEFRSSTDLITDNSQPDSIVSDLRLSIRDTPEGLEGTWEYNAAVFDELTMRRMAGHFQNLLSSVIANPGESICRLPLLGTHERIEMLFAWNNTHALYPDDKCIHHLFEEQVKRSPAAMAVELYQVEDINRSSKEKSLTYHQLNSRANQLAHYLLEVGVGPDVLVGVYMTRSVEMMISLLGILKAGGAYLPLDPVYPRQRLEYMLQDSGVTVVLTENKLVTQLDLSNHQVICVDTQWERLSECSNKNPLSAVSADNLAYVIYTSGSTGQPKGTLIIHRGVVNYLSWCVREYRVVEGSGAPVNSSIAFDATVTSIFSPLLVGKRVLLLPEKEEIEALGAVLDSGSPFSLVKITPAHLEVLRHLLDGHQVQGQTKALIIGGEALLLKNIEGWRTNSPNTRLINEYGPTETVVGCCTYEIPRDKVLSDIPIGKPIANTQIYILDAYMEPVPVGVTGEIYIGGAGLARGYLNRPELTQQKFVPSPFADDPSVKLYKTGDLGRYLADGNIVFQGRIDQQVKIRGYRIELGEIESALAQHPSVKQVTVIAREDNPGEKRLVAYVVPTDTEPSITTLRLHVSEKLPDYMVPAAFVFMQVIPLTANGKVDRTALPLPGQVRSEKDKPYIGPRNETEKTLAKIFEKCLHVPKISMNDDFFELGGSSIQAAYIFGRIRKIFHKRLPLSTLIQAPAIEKLAKVIGTKAAEVPAKCLVPIQPDGSKPPLFCIHGGWGNVLFYRHLAKHLGNDQPVYALQAKGLVDDQKPHESIPEMAAEYIQQIKTVQPLGPYYLAGYCFGAIAAFEMAQQLLKNGEHVAFLGSFNGIAPKIYSAHSKISRWQTFKLLNTKMKIVYSFKLLKFALRVILKGYYLSERLRRFAYRYYFKRNKPLPDSLKRVFIVESIMKAQSRYIAKEYPGQLVIFRSPKIFPAPDLGWNRWINNIKTYDIPGEHGIRTRIMYEPFVQFLAKELSNHLEKERRKYKSPVEATVF